MNKVENQNKVQTTDFGEVMESDILRLQEIALIQDGQERQKQVHQRIGEIIEDYEKVKGYASFNLMMKRFQILHYGLPEVKERLETQNIKSDFGTEEIDRAWNEEQMDAVLDIFEKQHYGAEEKYGQARYFWRSFITSRKKGREQNTVSDILAKSLTEKIERGDKLSSALQEEMRMWFQQIHMVDSDIRLNFLVAILNNPGAVDSYTRSEAIGNIGLGGEDVIDQLKKSLEINSQDTGKMLSTIRILTHLWDKINQTGFDDTAREAKKLLAKIREDSDNYFIKAKTEQVLTPPLENYSISEKRDFLRGDWKNLMDPKYFHKAISEPLSARHDLADSSEVYYMDITDPQLFSDEEVDQIFRKYRSLAGSYYYWNEFINRTSRFEEGHLRKEYDIIPLTAQGEYYQEKITREACYSRINNSYGVIYTLDGNVDSFFHLNPATEQEVQKEREKLGTISQRGLGVFISRFKEGLENGNLGKLLYYLQLRKGLPQYLQDSLDAILNLDIPEELDQKYETIYQFEEKLASHQKELLDKIQQLSEEKLKKFISALRGLEKQKEQRSQEKFFGYKSDDPHLIDFFRSFVKQDPSRTRPSAHHSICYYIYLRKWLPDEFVSEFEKKFSLEFPQEFERFSTFDDYLAVSDERLLQPFMQGDFQEMSAWLDRNLEELSDKIKSKKRVPERMTISEILEKEGFSRERIQEDDFKRLILTYRSLLELPLRERLETEFGIKLVDFSVREQVQFVNFLSTKSEREVARVKRFLEQGSGKSNRVKAFLSLEFGRDLSENLFTISENINPEQADLIFARYAGLADLAHQAEREIIDSVRDKEKAKKIDSKRISQDLLRRGKDILATFAQKIKESKKKNGDISTEEILSDLNDYHQDLVFTSAVIKEGKKEGLTFEDFEGAQFRVMSAREVFENKNMFSQMCEIYKKNWKHENPSFQAKLIRGFTEKIEKGGEDVTLFVFEKDGEVVAFSRSDRVGPGKRYFASLNVIPSMQGLAVGQALKQASVEIEGKGNDIEADCDPTDPKSTPLYIMKDGYVATGAILDYAGTGKYLLTILRERNPKAYYFRGKPEAEVVEHYIRNNIGNKFNKEDELIVLKFEPDSEEMKQVTDQLLNQKHYRITNYFFDTEDKAVYCAFESGGKAS